MKIPLFVYGIYARILNVLIPVKEKTWAFGADYGRTYREGSKYMLEYMLKEHPDYDCFFVTRNKQVIRDLTKKGIPCYLNTSLKGIRKLVQAECVFTTQAPSDILFDFKKKKRRYFYISHGMPFKRGFKAVLDRSILIKNWTGVRKFFKPLLKYFTKDNGFDDCEFEICTSDFLKPYVKMYFGETIPIKVIGFPRLDAFFDESRMSQEKWLPRTEGKFIITYMPTHRVQGTGELSPYPFENRPDVQNWMKENNILFVMKQHPNFIPKTKDTIETDTFVNITKRGFDPQVCLYHTDVLITDFSTVWIDYLILQRPLIFYYYDDYLHKDWGQLYDIKDDPPGSFCYDSDELFEAIKRVFFNYKSMRPSDRLVHKYHKFIDGNSCQRYYEAITSNSR